MDWVDLEPSVDEDDLDLLTLCLPSAGVVGLLHDSRFKSQGV